jgi:mannose-6-phosphate isomerase-like protein (cupin superfamily)
MQYLPFETKMLQENYDYLAPDGSEIRKLLYVKGGGLAHCTLPPGKTSSGHVHKTVDEIWYCIGGEGEVWRKYEQDEETVKVKEGSTLTIPQGTSFQFRNISQTDSFYLLIATIPNWPSPSEAIKNKDHW